MTKIYSFFLCLLALNGFSQTIQSENFNGTAQPAGWTTNAIIGTRNWEFGLYQIRANATLGWQTFSTNAAIFDDGYNSVPFEPNEVDLISPAVDITSYSTINLSFNYLLWQPEGETSTFSVDVWNGASWIQIFTTIADVNPTVKDFDVTAYKNAAFKVRFKYKDTKIVYGAGVDDFLLSGVLGVDDITKSNSNISVYPIPATNYLSINTKEKVSRVAIVNELGQNMSVTAIENNTVNIANLKKGMYILTYEVNGQAYTNKFIKK